MEDKIKVCLRLKSGKEFQFECTSYKIKKYDLTGELEEVEFESVTGDCPIYFRTADVESISRYIEGQKEE